MQPMKFSWESDMASIDLSTKYGILSDFFGYALIEAHVYAT